MCRMGFVPRINRKSVWIHAASVGEVGVAISIRDILYNIDPNQNIFITAVTKMGLRRLQTAATPKDKSCAFPLDFRPFIWNAFNRANPKILIVIETELWPNLLTEAKRRQIPAILLNGRISNSTLSWAKRYPKTFNSITSCFKLFLMKSETDAANLLDTGVEPKKVRTIGNLKFAGIPSTRVKFERYEYPTVVFGSARPDEFEQIACACKSIKSRIKNPLFIVAPRHLNTIAQARTILNRHGLSTTRRSLKPSPGDADVYLIDTIGELLGFYAIADVAFVGGTLADYGGHNPLEPAFYAKPVVVGPYTSSNREAYEILLKGGGAVEVHNSEELADEICRLLENDKERLAIGQTAYKLVNDMRDIVDCYEEEIKSLYKNL